jgi:hypothetical protein
MPQTVLLRSELSLALRVGPRQRVELQGGFRWTWGLPGRKRKERSAWGGGSTGRKACLPDKRAEHVGSLELRNIGAAPQIARELAYQIPQIEGQVVMSTFRASRGQKYRGL